MKASAELRHYIAGLDMQDGGGVGRTDVWQEQYRKVQGSSVDDVLKRFAAGHYMSCQGVRAINQPKVSVKTLLAELDQSAAAVSDTKAAFQRVKHAALDGAVSYEFRLAYAYFRSVGLAEEFVDFCTKQGLFPDWVLARNFYYARNVVGLLKVAGLPRPASFLEVGAGSGAMAIMLYRMGVVRRFTIIDLPEMLAFAAYEFERHLPGVPIHFGPTGGPDEGFTMVKPTEVDAIDASVDFSMNFISFAEMEKRWVDLYFSTIYRLSRPGAVHYNVNRTHQNLHQSDGSHYYSHPLLYPYQADDDLLMWDSDPLQDVCRSWLLKRPRNPAYARAAMLKGGGERKLMPARAFEEHSLEDLLAVDAPGWLPWRPAAPRV